MLNLMAELRLISLRPGPRFELLRFEALGLGFRVSAPSSLSQGQALQP